MHAYPLLVTLLLLSLTSILGWLLPWPGSLGPAWQVLGWVLFTPGALLILVAGGLFRYHGTTVNPTRPPDKLVVHGLYRFSRNPMYLGMLLMLIGLPFIRDFLPGLAFALVFFVYMDRWLIPAEERRVHDCFGEDYRHYQARTRRWL